MIPTPTPEIDATLAIHNKVYVLTELQKEKVKNCIKNMLSEKGLFDNSDIAQAVCRITNIDDKKTEQEILEVLTETLI